LNTVRYIDSIRKRLSPATLVNLEELGTILPLEQLFSSGPSKPYVIPGAYWNLSAALYAYLYMEATKLGIDAAGESQLLADSPEMNSSVAMMDRKTGQPTARFRVLQLIKNHFGPGDQLIFTRLGPWANLGVPFGEAADVAAQAFVTAKGKKLLLVNKRAEPRNISTRLMGRITDMEVMDVKTGDDAPRHEKVQGETLHLEPFAVAVVTID